MNIAHSSFKLFLANVGSAAVSFLGITYFAHKLGATVLGVFFLFEAILGMLAVPADFGIGGAVEKRISEGREPDEVLSTAVILKLIPLSVIITAILTFQRTINNYLGANIAIFLILAIVLKELAQLMVFVIQGELRVEETALLRLSRHVVWVGVGGILTLMGYGVHGLVYGLLAGLSVMLIWGFLRKNTPFGKPSLEYARSLFDYSKYAFISSVGGYFYQWIDVAIIGLFLTQAHVGAYEVAWRVTLIVMLFSKAIATSIFPQVSEWNASGAVDAIESMIPSALTASLIFVIPSFFGVLFYSKKLLGLFFGHEFIVAWLVLIVLMAEKLLQAPHLILGRSLQGINRPDLAARAGVVAMVLNLGLNVVLVWQLGLIGAAIATAASFAVNSFLHGYYLNRFIVIDFPYLEIGWCFASAVGMSVLLLIIQSVVYINTPIKLIVVIIIGAFAYGAFILLYGPLRVKVLRNLEKYQKVGR